MKKFKISTFFPNTSAPGAPLFLVTFRVAFLDFLRKLSIYVGHKF